MPATQAARAAITRFGATVYRVTDTITGHKITLKAELVEANPDRYQIINEPAVDGAGTPLPPTFARPPARAEETPEPEPEPALEETI